MGLLELPLAEDIQLYILTRANPFYPRHQLGFLLGAIICQGNRSLVG